MFDVHWRIGGTNGTQLQSNNCAKTPNTPTVPNPECFGTFLLLHITTTASMYMSNNWGWVSDHDMDLPGKMSISAFQLTQADQYSRP